MPVTTSTANTATPSAYDAGLAAWWQRLRSGGWLGGSPTMPGYSTNNLVITTSSATVAYPQIALTSSSTLVYNTQWTVNDGVLRQPASPPPPTAEEQERQRALERQWVEQERARTERRRERERRIQLGEERARVLLLSCLAEEQRLEFEERGFFHVRSPSGRLFRLEYRTSGNVIEVDPRYPQVERACYCIHPRDVPVPDTLLAQKLHLETDCERTLALANRHR